ncbi:NAC domain-containing protein 7-like [Cryptomeria japonica]|uniref:NAC domain-containing protein 7-like n=1 Tax=Cryptomeria japonica TaxID=3369 RepID=UPI0027DA90F9|nr:NAC domain-containing protein 7-like [Cryptomeria japonica]
MNALISGLPLGYRFRPTEEELLDYYLKKRIASERIDMDLIRDIDLYKIEPWDLQEIYGEDAREWYVFNKNNKKGSRICRSTAGGYWKETGKDKPIYSKQAGGRHQIGQRKILVFYKGRSSKGQRSEWIMHEYRRGATPQDKEWVICHIFHKRIKHKQKRNEEDNEEDNKEDNKEAEDQVEEEEEEEVEEEEAEDQTSQWLFGNTYAYFISY